LDESHVERPGRVVTDHGNCCQQNTYAMQGFGVAI